MLILARRVGETLKIGEDVDVTVLSIQGNDAEYMAQINVHTYITRMYYLDVHREEVFLRIQREKALAETA